MPDAVDGVIAKIARAHIGLAELDTLSLRYLMSDPATFDVFPNKATSTYTVTAHIMPPPLELAVVFGEVLHNLRSALDYVARMLVIANGGTPVDQGRTATAFPILRRPPAQQIDVTPGLSEPARAALESVQPFTVQDPLDHPLWRLHELNNIDKHRLLHVTALSGAGGVAFVPAPLDPTVPTTQEQRRHAVHLLPEQPQRFDVTADEMHFPAAMAGLWSSTVVLGEPGAGFSEQLVGIGMSIATCITDQVLPTLEPFLRL